MVHHVAFLRAIAASPNNPIDRFAYADWLEEQAEPLAELLRVQGEVVSHSPLPDELAGHEWALLKRHRRRGDDSRRAWPRGRTPPPCWPATS